MQAENDAQVDSELIKKAVSEIEEIGEAFLNFNESNNEFIKLVESQQCGHEEDTMKNINADYVGYISDIESAMNPIKNENDANEYNRRYNEKFGGLVAKANSEDEKKENLKNISDFVASLNAITSEIPKIKKEYRGAQDDASAIKKLVKYYVKFVKDNIGVNIINKTNISEWKPPANISNTPKIKLSQAIPYVYYCVSKYEENGFGLNKDIVEVIEESDRATFGMTLRDIKQAVKSKNV